jgi:DNA-binding transcriptional MerR regulator
MAMTADPRSYRIGEVAERFGVTARTIRYYEELGLIASVGERRKGARRLYDETSIDRLQHVLQLRDLLGLSLDAIVALAEAEESHAALRETWRADPSCSDRLRILDEATPLVERQLELVRERQLILSRFARELRDTLRAIEERRAELEGGPGAPQ